jgi:N-acetylmuramoyl-L-alanine amidase
MRLLRLIACLEILLFSIAFPSDLEILDQDNKDHPAAVEREVSRRINEFVNDYYRALSHRDIEGVLATFDTKVDYLGSERAKDYIRKDLTAYLKRWAVTIFAPEDLRMSRIGDRKFLVHFTLSYTVRNDASSDSGFTKNAWVLHEANGRFQISSQKETAQSRVGENSVSQASKGSHQTAKEGQVKISGTPPSLDVKRAIGPGPEVEIPSAKPPTPSSTPAPKAVAYFPTAPQTGRPPAAKKSTQNEEFTLAIDVGHSRVQGGAISAHGIFEYEFNRRLAGELFEVLQTRGFSHSFIINPQGGEIRLLKRAETANNRKADLLLAIHHDSVKDTFLKDWKVNGKTEKYCDQFHGYSIFFSRKNVAASQSRMFAFELAQALLEAGLTPTLHHVAQEHRPIIDPEKGVYAFDDLVVLKGANMPAVLLECGVIVNRQEEEKLNTKEYRSRIIDAVGSAIANFSKDPTMQSQQE